jgi:hypothetical protein
LKTRTSAHVIAEVAMPYKFYCIPVRDDGTATEELNAFLHQQFGMTDIVSAMAVPEPSMIIDALIILELVYGMHWSRQNLNTA